MSIYKDKRVLVTGGAGLIGIPLVTKLVDAGALVHVVAADPIEHWEVIRQSIPQLMSVFYYQRDLTHYGSCEQVVISAAPDYVFQLAGSKGSNAIGHSRGATFFDTHMLINMNMLRASHEAGVQKYLLTSTVGVYPPGSNFTEGEMWNGNPGEGDKYSAWAKRMAELQAEAYREEYKWDGIVIVRPGSVYGPWDNFDPATTMVIGSLINKIFKQEHVDVPNSGVCRDFTFADDIADGMILALEKSGMCEAFNLGSGVPSSVGTAATIIATNFRNNDVTLELSKSLPHRVLDITKARTVLGFDPKTSLTEGLGTTTDWYIQNHNRLDKKYNVFQKKGL